jgi:hypothetical protein
MRSALQGKIGGQPETRISATVARYALIDEA